MLTHASVPVPQTAHPSQRTPLRILDRRAHLRRNLRFGDNVWFSKMLESD